MTAASNLWDFLDGKKVLIGAILSFAVYVVKGIEFYFGFHIVDDATLNQVSKVSEWVVGFGLAHKVYKSM